MRTMAAVRLSRYRGGDVTYHAPFGERLGPLQHLLHSERDHAALLATLSSLSIPIPSQVQVIQIIMLDHHIHMSMMAGV